MPTNQEINDVEPRTQFIATSGQTVFNASWTADDEDSVLVYARATGVAADDATQLVSSSDYTVTFVGSSETVRVTFSSGRTLDDVITLVRDTDSSRTNLYINSNFTPSMLNQDFGIETMVQQQNQMNRSFAPHYNFSCTYTDNSNPDIDLILPILDPNHTWAMNPAGTEIIAYDITATGGLVNIIDGTTNQIDVDSTDPTEPVLSLSSTIQFPGTTGYSDTSGILDENGNEQLIFNTTASAVNYVELTNAATGNGPLIQAAGDDANIDLKIQAKGTGNVLFDGSDVICGNPGTEASGIDIGGANYNSNLKSSELGATNLAQFIMHRHSTTVSPVIVGARSNSNTSAHTAVTAGQSLFVTYGAGWTGAEYNLFGGIDISVDASGTISDASSPGRIRLQVTADGATVPSTALTIANDKTVTLAGDLDMSMTDGQLLIGNTGSALSKATLTAGAGISVSNAGGRITISATGGGGGVDANFTFMLMGA